MIYHLSFRRTLKGSVWVLGLFKLKWITWWSLWEKIIDTVNCCFVWFLWNVNVSQILHKQLNKFDWSKIQLVVWQNNQRYLKFCLLIFLFHLLVECFFLMDDLFFFFLLVFDCWGWLDGCCHICRCGKSWLWWMVSHPALLGHVLRAVLFEERRFYWLPFIPVPWPTSGCWGQTSLVYYSDCCCCCLFQKHDSRNLR